MYKCDRCSSVEEELYYDLCHACIKKLQTELPTESVSDPVNHPQHYTTGGVECIDAIEASMTAEAFRGYCKGCTLKYLWRYTHKGNVTQDLDKAAWYLTKLRNTYTP